MKLSCVRLNKDVYVYACGRSLSGTIEGPAEVIGSWVKCTVIDKHGKPQEILIWGAHTLPSELAPPESWMHPEVQPTQTLADADSVIDGILGSK